MVQRLDLTQGNISGQLLRLAGPILIGMVVFTLYLLMDLWFVGRLGPDAVAALSISSNIFFVHLGLSLILGTGAMALVARAAGKGDLGRAANVFAHSLLLCLVSGMVFAVIGYVLAEPYILFFGGRGKSLEWGTAYFKVYALTIVSMLLIHVFGACYRGLGDTKTSMLIMFQSLVLNMVLDPLLIFGLAGFPALGVSGAAIATLASQCYGVLVYGVLVFIKKQHVDLSKGFSFDPAVIRDSLAIGLPSGLTYFVFTGNLLINYRFVGPYGTEALAALGIGFRILQAIYLPGVAVSEAMAAMAGQNYGARDKTRVNATFWAGFRLIACFMAAGTVLGLLFPAALVRLFSSDPEVVRYGVMYLKIISLSNVLVAVIFSATAVFQGIGRTYPTLACALADNLLFALLVFTLPGVFGWGISAVWWLKLCATVVETFLSAVWLHRLMTRIKI